MNLGRTVFAQLMDLVPSKAFDLAVRRHDGKHRVGALSRRDQLLRLILAQLMARGTDYNTTRSVQSSGFRRPSFKWISTGLPSGKCKSQLAVPGRNAAAKTPAGAVIASMP